MTTPVLESRLPNVGTTIFTVIGQLAAKHQAINLSQGAPNFPCSADLVRYAHEAMQAGAAYALGDDDWIFPSYRESAIGLLRAPQHETDGAVQRAVKTAPPAMASVSRSKLPPRKAPTESRPTGSK